MRRILLISLILTLWRAHADGKEHGGGGHGNTAEIDITALVNHGRLGIGFSHMFCGRWAAGFESTIRISPGKDEEDMVSNAITFHYWPRQTVNGPVIGAGYRPSVRSEDGFFADIGYRCRIHGGLGLRICYRASLLEERKDHGIGAGTLRLTLEYGF